MNIEISKYKARRGTNEQRKTLVFDQGEIIYTLDTKRIFVGNGLTFGGVPVGNRIHPPIINYSSLSTIVSEVGDLVCVNGIFYQLIDTDFSDLNSWQRYRLEVEPIIFSYTDDNVLKVNQESISSIYIDPTTVSNGIKIDSGILQTDFNAKSLEISAFKLSLKQSGIDEREISSTTFINGISGGSGNKIGLDVDSENFYFVSNTLSLSGWNPFDLRFTDLNDSWFGAGLTYSSATSSLSTILTDVNGDDTILRGSDGKIGLNTSIFGSGLDYNITNNTLSTIIIDVDNSTLIKTSGVASLPSLISSTSNQWPSLSVDDQGRITGIQSTIFDTLTSSSSTTLSALSSDGSVLSLSTLGFLTFEEPITTRNGQTANRFAIPIYTY